MISIVWTTSNKFTSKAIRKLTNSESSHVVFMIDESLIFHSNWKGVNIEWAGRFFQSNQEIYRIDLDLDLIGEEQIFQVLLTYDGRPYDYRALWYLGLAYLGVHFGLKTKIVRNKWGTKNALLCVELLEILRWKFNIVMPDLEITPPDHVYHYLKSALKDNLSSSTV